MYKKNPSTPDLHINCNLTSDNMPKIHLIVLIIKRLKTRSTAEVADTFNVSHRQVQRIRKRYEETGDVFDKPRSGRPRKTTVREDRLLARKSKASPFSTAAELHETWSPEVPVSTRRVCQILSRNGLHGRISAQKPALNKSMGVCERSAGWKATSIRLKYQEILAASYIPNHKRGQNCSRMVLHRILPSLHQSSSRRRRSRCSRIGQPSHQT